MRTLEEMYYVVNKDEDWLAKAFAITQLDRGRSLSLYQETVQNCEYGGRQRTTILETPARSTTHPALRRFSPADSATLIDYNWENHDGQKGAIFCFRAWREAETQGGENGF